MAGQTKRGSAIETAVSTLVGFAISYVANIYIMRAFGHELNHGDNFIIVCLFTIISLVRGYVLRRFFNLIHVKFGV